MSGRARKVPTGQQCGADGCTSRRVTHGAGRCETHFQSLAVYVARNPEDSEARKVRRAVAARKRLGRPTTAQDGPGGHPAPGTPESGVEADSGRSGADRAETGPVESPVTHERDPWKGRGTPDSDELEKGRAMVGKLYRSAVEAVEPDGAGGWRPVGRDPLEVWRVMRDAVADHGLPDSILPPRPVPAETRPDPILPVVESVSEPPERTAGRLAFGGLVDATGEPMDGQLPLLPSGDAPMVPILELVDQRGGPIMARGRGAPLDLRLFVGACLWTPHNVRSGRVRLAVKVRELRDFVYPNPGTFKLSRHWPIIRAALWRAGGYWLPGRYEWEGHTVRGWVPFRLAGGIGDNPDLDDMVLIDVELPPGSTSGPVIDRRELARLGVQSAPRFRAYIAAHSVAWRPGVTRFPHPRNRGVKLWAGDRDRYPILTAADRRRLAFGADDRKHRTRAEQAAPWEDLPGVEIVTRSASTPDGRRGWVIVPDAAAAAIKRRKASDPTE